MPPQRTEAARAKINLTLHVTGQRADGYHLLDSLVVFADIGDRISVTATDRLRLEIDGPFAAGLAADDSNLVLRAARLLCLRRGAQIRLTKNLPIASGIGGGSADAAATLRALSQLWAVALPATDAVAGLGADVPACLYGKPLRLRGIGGDITALPALPGLDILLVNPGVHVPTPMIFKALAQKTNAPMPADLPDWPDAQAFCNWLATQRNDLLPAAAGLAPQIADALATLRATDCLFAGMSGSGATCFGLFLQDGHSARDACAQVQAAHPGWWAACGQLMRATT
jgi:4-diphosphocytidyl-2-C-methyl-D-erythritol kinase